MIARRANRRAQHSADKHGLARCRRVNLPHILLPGKALVADPLTPDALFAVSPKEMVSRRAPPCTIWLMVPAVVAERFTSRGDADFANRVLSAMRYGFGGHVEKLLP